MLNQDKTDFTVKTNPTLLAGENFAYYAPCAKLSPLISNYTVTFPGKHLLPDDYTIVPHGSATLVFTYDGREIKSQLFGPLSRPCHVGKNANECAFIFIIEFQPAGLYAFTGIRQKDLIDQIVSFDLTDPALDNALKKVILISERASELLSQVEHLLLEKRKNAYPTELNSAIHLIIEHCGGISPTEISDAICYSERQLNRLFNQYLGFNMKHFSRIVRINQSIHLLNNTQNSLSYVSDMAGFYDLSHFIKDFKAVTGINPREYRRNMSDFYSEIAKF